LVIFSTPEDPVFPASIDALEIGKIAGKSGFFS
jgi:hypothetical protein